MRCSWSHQTCDIWLHRGKIKPNQAIKHMIQFYFTYSISFTMPAVNPVPWKIRISLILLGRGFPQVVQSITAFTKQSSSYETAFWWGQHNMLTSGPQLQGRRCSGIISLLTSSFHISSSACVSLQGLSQEKTQSCSAFPSRVPETPERKLWKTARTNHPYCLGIRDKRKSQARDGCVILTTLHLQRGILQKKN